MPHRPHSQVFLHDRSIAARLCALVPPVPGRATLEIGPGKGIITRELVAAGHDVVCVEIDPKLAEEVSRFVPAVRVVTGSILDFVPRDLVPCPARVVGALPYHLSGAILRWLADHADSIETAALVLQEEVVERMAAPPGHRSRGLLSVILQSVYRVEPGFRIRAGSFTPAPRVGSRVVVLTRLPNGPSVAACLHVWDVARVLFRHPRKMIRSALMLSFGEDGYRRAVASGVDLTARPQELSLSDVETLASALT